MSDPIFGFVLAAVVACVSALIVAVRARRSVGGVRVVTCPENGCAAAVRFDSRRVAVMALRQAEPDLRLVFCSRWASRGPCDQPCVPDARKAENLVRNIAGRWFAQKLCALCGKPLADAPAVGHHVAAISADGVTTEWPDIRAEALPDLLRTSRPVCWDCHIAEAFRLRYPDLVTDRRRLQGLEQPRA